MGARKTCAWPWGWNRVLQVCTQLAKTSEECLGVRLSQDRDTRAQAEIYRKAPFPKATKEQFPASLCHACLSTWASPYFTLQRL